MTSSTSQNTDDGHFMDLCNREAQKSKDPETQVGACVVNKQEVMIGIGYNQMPKGLDSKFPWNRRKHSYGDPLQCKHSFVCHAELNAIVNAAGNKLEGCKIYCTLFPCGECAKLIAQTGITEVIFKNDPYAHKPEYKIAKKIFDEVEITYRTVSAVTDSEKKSSESVREKYKKI